MTTSTTPDEPYDPATDPDSDPGMLNPRTGAAASEEDADRETGGAATGGDGDPDADPDADPDNLNPRG